MTLSTGFRTTGTAFQNDLLGSSDAFIAKIRLTDPMLRVVQTNGTFELTWPATAPDYVLQSSMDLSPPQTWLTVPQVPLLTNGEYLVNFISTNTSTLFRLFRLP
jgi:hypothetical protein